MESFLPTVLGSVINIILFSAFIAAVLKIFQAAEALNEIKDAIKSMQRNQDSVAALGRTPAAVAFGQTGDEMLRSLDAELHLSADSDAVKPEIISPR